jgi:hypothetical protein
VRILRKRVAGREKIRTNKSRRLIPCVRVASHRDGDVKAVTGRIDILAVHGLWWIAEVKS